MRVLGSSLSLQSLGAVIGCGASGEELKNARVMNGAMNARGFWRLEGISDVELVETLKELVGRSSWTEARIVAHLAELDARRLHLLGGRSLFRYCQECLGLSQNEAFYRIQAARLAQRFPVIFELLERRQVHLTALALVRDFITAENHAELLRDVSGKTKEQILRLLATRAPRPDVPSRIRKLPVPAGAVAAGPTGTLEPLSLASYRLQLNASESLKQKLELAANLMSHANPSRDLAIVVERALDLLIEKLHKERFGKTARPGRRRTPNEHEQAPSRRNARHGRNHIPNETLRQLLERDGLSCSYTAEDGHRCGEQAFLQIHHEQAWAKGGADSLDNLRLVCAPHNRLLAERDFGATHIQRAIDQRTQRPDRKP